ncbi:hypothetical protein [Flavobacterium sp.]|uniref:hypothetical protein n=1 Tax=Flavobacterium sp. TaxID=239 RepID=UPI0025E6103E|nr:hypothetical protein [Flavobacterium sp.]
MKKLNLIFLILLLCAVTAKAQFGNPNNSLRSNRMPMSAPKKPSAEEVAKNKEEQIDKFINKLKKDLTLDELQTIAIKNEIVANSRNIDIVTKKEISDESKSSEIKAMMDKTEVIINSYLNKEQKEKYIALKAGGKSKTKDKKTKKEDTNTEK